jgi:hypothetical protein
MNSVTTPLGVIRPIRPIEYCVNQRLPSGPAVMNAWQLRAATLVQRATEQTADTANDQQPHFKGRSLEDLAGAQARIGDGWGARQAWRSALAAHEKALAMNATNPIYFADYARPAETRPR